MAICLLNFVQAILTTSFLKIFFYLAINFKTRKEKRHIIYKAYRIKHGKAAHFINRK